MSKLTVQELAAIKDQLTAEQNLVNKFMVYSQTITDVHLSEKCKEIAGKHQQHYNKLLSYLNCGKEFNL